MPKKRGQSAAAKAKAQAQAQAAVEAAEQAAAEAAQAGEPVHQIQIVTDDQSIQGQVQEVTVEQVTVEQLPQGAAATEVDTPTEAAAAFDGNNIVVVTAPTVGTNEAGEGVASIQVEFIEPQDQQEILEENGAEGEGNEPGTMSEAQKQQALLNQKKWKTKTAMTRKYRMEWEESFEWLTCTATDIPVAFCRVCKAILSNKFSTLVTHENARKHTKAMQKLEVQNIKAHYTTDEFNEPDLDMSDDEEAEHLFQSRMPKEAENQEERLPRKREPTPPPPEDPNDPKVVLRKMAEEMGYDAVMEALGPSIIFNNRSMFDILQKKAMIKTKEKCMREMGNEMETLLLEAKIFVENCFDLMPDSREGRIERFRRKGAQSIEISEILSRALDVPEGWWVQREKNDIRYRYGLECGVLTDIERLAAPPPARDPEQVGVDPEEAVNYDSKLAEPRAGYREKKKLKARMRVKNKRAKQKAANYRKPLKIKIEPGSKRFYTTAADRANRLNKRQKLTEADLDPDNDEFNNEDPDFVTEEMYAE